MAENICLTQSPVPSKKVTKSEKPDKSDKTEKSDKKNKKKSKKKNKDKDKKQGDWWIRQPPFTNFVGDFKVYFLNTEQKCL